MIQPDETRRSDEEIFESATAVEAEPARTETPSPEPAAVPSGVPAPAAAPAEHPSPPRDEKGRFTAGTEPGETPAADATEAEAASAPAPEAEPAATTESPDLSQYPPFEFEVRGQAHAIDGAVQGTDGVFFPEGAPTEQLRRWLGQAAETSRLQAEVGRARQEGRKEGERLKREAEAERQAGRELMVRLHAIGSDPDRLAEWATDPQTNLEALKRQAELELKKRDLDARERDLAEQAREAELKRLVPQCRQEIRDYIEHFAASEPEFKGLALDRDDLARWLEEQHFDDIFEEAETDMPEIGVSKGGIVVRHSVILDVMRREARTLKRALAASQQVRAIEQRNQQTKTPPQAPPVVAVTTTSPKANQPKPTFKNKDEADDWFWGSGQGLET